MPSVGRGTSVGARRLLVAALLVVGLAAVVVADGPRAADGQRAADSATRKPTFDELYRRGQDTNKGIKTITARFVETTSNALLVQQRPIVERGQIYVERPSRVALHYSDPAGRKTLIDGKWLTTVLPAQNINRRIDIGRAQSQMQRFVNGNAGDLRRIFDIELRDTSARRGTHEVLMLPRRREIREGLSQLELWVGESTGLLQAMRMTFPSGETKLMEFEDVVPNAPIDPSVFSAP